MAPPPPRRRMRRAGALTVNLVAALAIAATGCGAAEPPASRPDMIRIVTPYAVKSLDPVRQGLWSPEWGYGELLMRATENGTVEPWLLEDLTATSPTTWRLRLRPDVTFGNGRRLDATALKAAIDRHLTDNALVRTNLAGAATAVADARTVTLTTARPVANLPHLLADEQGVSVFDTQAAPRGAAPETLVGKGIYTGPFQVERLSADEMVLKRNPKYWGGRVKLAGARVRFVPDGQARVLAVRSGEADVALYPPTELLTQVRDAASGPRMAAAKHPLQQLRAIFNLRAAPMDDPAVRRAFALAVDYQQLAGDVFDGLYEAPVGWYPKTVAYAEATQRTDQEAARRQLEGTGWRAGQDGIRRKAGQPLTVSLLTYPQQPDTRTAAVALQAQLRQVGFDVRIREVPDNYAAMKERDWHVGLSFDGTLGYTFDPVGPLRDFLSTTGVKNFGGVTDPRLDALISDLAGTFDATARHDLLRQAQRLVAEQAYTVVLTQRTPKAVVSQQFASYRPSSVLHHLTAAS